MAWKDGYLQASFRDVSFFIRRASKKSGRRVASHIYPRRDEVDNEDMGRADREFTLDGYVVGDDYFDQREAFETALETEGPGILVHPYRGVLRVQVKGYTATEVTDEGRLARYSMTFSIQEIEELTVVVPNTQRKVSLAKEEVLAKSKEWFLDIYDLAQKPANAVADVRATLDKGLSVIEGAKRIAASSADFRRQIENTRGRFIALSLNAQLLANEFVDTINFGTDLATSLDFGANSENAQDQLREQKQIINANRSPLVSTPTNISEDPEYPAKQIQTLYTYAAIGAQIGLVGVIPFATAEDATTAQNDLFETINEVLVDPLLPDELYAALRDAKKAVAEDLAKRKISLPRIVEYTLRQGTDSLSLVYNLYGGLENEEDFIRRNRLIHPGFIPAGVSLQVKVEE